jgi:hypothetical protein
MIRKLAWAFMATVALGACGNAVGPNAVRNPTDPVDEQAGKEEYYDPGMPAAPADNPTPVGTQRAQPDTTVD